MRNRILKKVTKWYKNQEDKECIEMSDELLGLLIDKTAEAIFDEVNDEFKDEFEKGNLKQPFFISDEYYLYLKLKEIKYNFLKTVKTDPAELEKLFKKQEISEDK